MEIEGATLWGIFNEDDYDAIAGYQFTDDVLDAQQQIEYMAVDPAYHSGWVHEPVWDLAESASTELDEEKRCDMFKEIQAIYNEEAVSVLTVHNPFVVLMRNDVMGYHQIPLGWRVWRETWLDK